MKILKKVLSVVLIVVLVLAMVALHWFRKTKEHQMAVSIRSTQESIRALEEEKLALEEKLAGDDGEAGADSEEQENQQTEPMQAVLCVANVTEAFYEEIFPAMQEKGQTGIIILRNGRLPGDVTDDVISVRSFVDMIDSGWSYAITVTQYTGTSAESWGEAVDRYVDRLIARVASKPTMYCFVNGANEERLNLLEEKGFEAVLCHGVPEEEDLKVIQLLPYGSEPLEEAVSQINGYCGLEVWTAWEDDTEEALQYSEEKTMELLDNNSIELKGFADLRAMTALAEDGEEDGESAAGKYATEEEIHSRIAEIEAEIEALYRS